jgi:hypothetical protein
MLENQICSSINNVCADFPLSVFKQSVTGQCNTRLDRFVIKREESEKEIRYKLVSSVKLGERHL